MKLKEHWAMLYSNNQYEEGMDCSRGIAYWSFVAGFDKAKEELAKAFWVRVNEYDDHSTIELKELNGFGEEEIPA